MLNPTIADRKRYIRRLLNRAISAKKMAPGEPLVPILAVRVKGREQVYGLMDADTTTIARAVRQVINRERLLATDIESVSLVAEIWMRQATEAEMEAERVIGPRPSESQEEEALLALAVWPDGPLASGTLPIHSYPQSFDYDWSDYKESGEMVGPLAEAMMAWH